MYCSKSEIIVLRLEPLRTLSIPKHSRYTAIYHPVYYYPVELISGTKNDNLIVNRILDTPSSVMQ